MEKFGEKSTEKSIGRVSEGPSRFDPDVLNSLEGIRVRINFLKGFSDAMSNEPELGPLFTFEEYMEEDRRRGYTPKEVKRHRGKVRPEDVAAFDALVNEFNGRLDEIDDDVEALEEYERKFQKMILGERD